MKRKVSKNHIVNQITAFLLMIISALFSHVASASEMKSYEEALDLFSKMSVADLCINTGKKGGQPFTGIQHYLTISQVEKTKFPSVYENRLIEDAKKTRKLLSNLAPTKFILKCISLEKEGWDMFEVLLKTAVRMEEEGTL